MFRKLKNKYDKNPLKMILTFSPYCLIPWSTRATYGSKDLQHTSRWWHTHHRFRRSIAVYWHTLWCLYSWRTAGGGCLARFTNKYHIWSHHHQSKWSWRHQCKIRRYPRFLYHLSYWAAKHTTTRPTTLLRRTASVALHFARRGNAHRRYPNFRRIDQCLKYNDMITYILEQI